MWRKWRHAIVLSVVLIASWSGVGAAQTAENVLVVANAASPESNEVADYYLQARRIPPDQILRLEMPVAEDVSRDVYTSSIERPLAQWLTTHGAQDRILYIVLVKGVPLRITGTGTGTGTVASVDSELTLVYRKLAGATIAVGGPLKNSYFAGDVPITTAKPFSHRSQDIYLVTRLDGYTVADVKALIDRGVAPSQQGIVLLDRRLESTQSLGNRWLINAAAALKKLPGWEERAVIVASGKIPEGESVLGYYSWGSSDPARKSRHLNLRFMPGAVGGEFVSTDARTFQEPPADWQANDRPFRGSRQSLVGDLIRDGLTGVAGYVAEPYLGFTVRPDILFPAYLSGFGLADAFYLAMPSLSWTGIVVGDPLCAPFRTEALAAGDLNPGIDAATELPQFLSDRRVAALTATGVKADAAKLFAKSEVRLANADQAGRREALEQATVVDDAFTDAHLKLAALYAETREWDATIDRFRRVIAKDPDHAAALNDLAYTLATEKNAPAEALSFAKRAYTQPGARPEFADTLAWIYHLLGQDAQARPYIVSAMTQLPATPEIHVHGAAILVAVGSVDAAARALDTAVRLDAMLAERPDVRALRDRIDALR